MKRSMLVLTLTIGLSIPLLNGGAVAGNPKPVPRFCENCGMAGGCFFCGGDFSGGDSCLAWCDMCTLWGYCIDGPAFPDVSYQLGRTVKARSKNVRDVAFTDPYLAFGLLRLGRFPIIRESGTMYVTPVAVSANDLRDLAESNQQSAIVSGRMLSEALQINRLIEDGRSSPLVYSITLLPVDESTSILRLRLEKGAPVGASHTTLELTVVPSADPKTKESTWKIKDWKLS